MPRYQGIVEQQSQSQELFHNLDPSFPPIDMHASCEVFKTSVDVYKSEFHG